ncbi:hypothetical protein FRY98_02655 [Paenibacillus faecis]|uniref:YncE family protein n=1 Tax=Paenibacillus faecis TaxID=862114 RepID=A0A5D0CY14_9BACL|nr:hypothetical protein [Paenibacillus faecis]TYA14603.1 hypothetical protein FRY98_02655 [Paenibacillus faecis]
MYFKTKVILLSLILSFLVTACTSNNKIIDDENSNANGKLNIYINEGGNLGIVNITKLSDVKVDYIKKTVDFKKDGDILFALKSISSSKVLGTFYDKLGGQLNNKYVVLQPDKISKIALEHDGPSSIVSDSKRHRAYILSAIKPNVYKKGIPLDIIDTVTNQKIGEIGIKGVMLNYQIYDNYLFMTVVKANELGYKEVPDNYILKINLDNNEQRILTPQGFDYSPKGMYISRNGTIFIIEMPLDPEQFDDCRLLGYDSNGKLIKNFPVDPGARDILIDDKGVAYITHNDKYSYSDRKGDMISLININTGKSLGNIQGLNSPTEIQVLGNYLFVINDGNNSISIINKEKKKIISSIGFGKNVTLKSMQIVSNINSNTKK